MVARRAPVTDTDKTMLTGAVLLLTRLTTALAKNLDHLLVARPRRSRMRQLTICPRHDHEVATATLITAALRLSRGTVRPVTALRFVWLGHFS